MSDLSDAWHHVKVPIVAVIGIMLIGFISFAAIRPEALQVQRPAWSITGNTVVDQQLFDSRITAASPCADIDDPVCGNDEKTYRNLCEAHKAGAEMIYHAPCTWTKE